MEKEIKIDDALALISIEFMIDGLTKNNSGYKEIEDLVNDLINIKRTEILRFNNTKNLIIFLINTNMSDFNTHQIRMHKYLLSYILEVFNVEPIKETSIIEDKRMVCYE